MSNVRVHVGRVVLDGFSPDEQRAVVAALRESLATIDAPTESASIHRVVPAPVPARAPTIAAAVRGAIARK